jgi:hypothetical protein
MSRCVVNVATGRYIAGQVRLQKALDKFGEKLLAFCDLPRGCPLHLDVPYAFKAFALEAASLDFDQLLWADASIVVAKPLDSIWRHAGKHGVWFSRNGYNNSEWTATSAYPDLGVTPEENEQIPHVSAGAFAVDLCHPKGHAFLVEYFRMASETRAFCGHWTGGIGVQHRHDQTAASVIAWRLGVPLTEPPTYFSYRGGETEDTILIADGAY